MHFSVDILHHTVNVAYRDSGRVLACPESSPAFTAGMFEITLEPDYDTHVNIDERMRYFTYSARPNLTNSSAFAESVS
jgi:hypothetical protein